MHPLIEEMLRVRGVKDLQAEKFHRYQRLLRDDIQPMLDERDRLIEENAALKEQVAKSAKKVKAEVAA